MITRRAAGCCLVVISWVQVVVASWMLRMMTQIWVVVVVPVEMRKRAAQSGSDCVDRVHFRALDWGNAQGFWEGWVFWMEDELQGLWRELDLKWARILSTGSSLGLRQTRFLTARGLVEAPNRAVSE